MKQARLIKRTEHCELEKTSNMMMSKHTLSSLNRDTVQQWINERKTKSETNPRRAFSALFAQLGQN